MKKIFGMVLLCMMVFTLAACGRSQESAATAEAEGSSAAEAAAATVTVPEIVEETVAETITEETAYDFTGKTLIPFNTSASGGFGRSLSGIEESAAGAEILEGFTVTSDQVEGAQEDVSAWISGLGLEAGGTE